MELLYRNAVIIDAADMANLSSQLGYPVTTDTMEQNLAEVLDKKLGKVLVAEHNGKIVGWLHVQESISLESGHYSEIIGLVVDETMRNKGIGKVLVDKAKEWTKQTGLTRLRVRTNVKRLAAHRFYYREGFRETKEQKSLEVIL